MVRESKKPVTEAVLTVTAHRTETEVKLTAHLHSQKKEEKKVRQMRAKINFHEARGGNRQVLVVNSTFESY